MLELLTPAEPGLPEQPCLFMPQQQPAVQLGWHDTNRSDSRISQQNWQQQQQQPQLQHNMQTGLQQRAQRPKVSLLSQQIASSRKQAAAAAARPDPGISGRYRSEFWRYLQAQRAKDAEAVEALLARNQQQERQRQQWEPHHHHQQQTYQQHSQQKHQQRHRYHPNVIQVEEDVPDKLTTVTVSMSMEQQQKKMAPTLPSHSFKKQQEHVEQVLQGQRQQQQQQQHKLSQQSILPQPGLPLFPLASSSLQQQQQPKQQQQRRQEHAVVQEQHLQNMQQSRDAQARPAKALAAALPAAGATPAGAVADDVVLSAGAMGAPSLRHDRLSGVESVREVGDSGQYFSGCGMAADAAANAAGAVLSADAAHAADSFSGQPAGGYQQQRSPLQLLRQQVQHSELQQPHEQHRQQQHQYQAQGELQWQPSIEQPHAGFVESNNPADCPQLQQWYDEQQQQQQRGHQLQQRQWPLPPLQDELQALPLIPPNSRFDNMDSFTGSSMLAGSVSKGQHQQQQHHHHHHGSHQLHQRPPDYIMQLLPLAVVDDMPATNGSHASAAAAAVVHGHIDDVLAGLSMFGERPVADVGQELATAVSVQEVLTMRRLPPVNFAGQTIRELYAGPFSSAQQHWQPLLNADAVGCHDRRLTHMIQGMDAE